MSKYVRAIQARSSYLVWKIYGERLDGYSNGDRGDDLDFTKGACAAPSRLTRDQKGLITRWIDLGCATDLYDEALRPKMRYTQDNVPPLLTVCLEESGTDIHVRVGLLDLESGIEQSSFRLEIVTASGRRIQADFSDLDFDAHNAVGLFVPSPRLSVNEFSPDEPFVVRVSVKDKAGNLEYLTKTVGSSSQYVK